LTRRKTPATRFFSVSVRNFIRQRLRILCHGLKSIECWWHKTEQIRSLGDDPTGGFAVDRLENAVLDGGLVAEQILRPRREEES
jgi:hypothetical protein